MPQKRLLLLSNSTNYGEAYLEYPKPAIKEFLGAQVKNVLFVPFAGVRMSHDEYAMMVRERFNEIGYQLDSIHEAEEGCAAVERAEAIVIGGGNTFQLLRGLYEANVVEAIRARCENGIPYVGWSAGANVACPTIKTTNDMPITEPPSFNALNLVPFQINPHYTEAQPPSHKGETRDERIAEFTLLNRDVYVVGLHEGTMLRIEGAEIKLIGERAARVFISDREPAEFDSRASLQFLFD